MLYLVCRRTAEGEGGYETGGLSKGRSTFTENTARPATGAVVLSVPVRFDAGQMLKLHALFLRLARKAHTRSLHACNLAYYGRIELPRVNAVTQGNLPSCRVLLILNAMLRRGLLSCRFLRT